MVCRPPVQAFSVDLSRTCTDVGSSKAEIRGHRPGRQGSKTWVTRLGGSRFGLKKLCITALLLESSSTIVRSPSLYFLRCAWFCAVFLCQIRLPLNRWGKLCFMVNDTLLRCSMYALALCHFFLRSNSSRSTVSGRMFSVGAISDRPLQIMVGFIYAYSAFAISAALSARISRAPSLKGDARPASSISCSKALVPPHLAKPM